MKKYVLVLLYIINAAISPLFCAAQDAVAPSATTASPPAAKMIPLIGRVGINGGKASPIESGWATFAIPGDWLTASVEFADAAPAYVDIESAIEPAAAKTYLVKEGRNLRWEMSGGAAKKFQPGGMQWQAPPVPGSYKLSALLVEEATYSRLAPEEKNLNERNIVGSFVFNFIVMQAFDKDSNGVIEGYPIGLYPNENDAKVREPVLSHREAYRPPKYFIKVTPENASTPISRHFTLGDFSPASENGKTHFIALDPSLVKRLEDLLDALKEAGIKVSSFKILRGFIPPNGVELMRRKGIEIAQFSRTIYGDSCIFIIDENGDGMMDDITGDGNVDQADFEVVAELVMAIEDKTRLFGGLGFSSTFKDPGFKDTPNFQIDTRGWRVRWSDD